MSKEINKEKQNAEAIAEAVSKTDLFFQKNKNLIIGIIAALVVVGVAFFCWHRFAYVPAVEEAQQQMYPAEESFRSQQYDIALNGDGDMLGFAQIIDDYGKKAGKAVYLYAGICEYNLGNYESAINYLKSYKGGDTVLKARALACIGDCYTALEDYATALSWFEKAAKAGDNALAASYLLKAGVVCEELGDNAKALNYYKSIKENYPQSIEGYDIDKYISRIETK